LSPGAQTEVMPDRVQNLMQRVRNIWPRWSRYCWGTAHLVLLPETVLTSACEVSQPVENEDCPGRFAPWQWRLWHRIWCRI